MSAFSVNIGYDNCIAKSRIVAVVSTDAAPTKRLREEAKKKGHLIDGTNGRKTRSVVVMDSGHVVLSALEPHTLAERLEEHAESDTDR